jgi:hypothetical protein
MFEEVKMEKKLYTGVLIFIGLVLIIALAFPAKKQAYDLDVLSFSSKSSTTLYFKNTRAFYYALEEMPEAGFDVFRFGKTNRRDTGTFRNFILVHNWRADEVYIVTEPTTALRGLGPVLINVGDTTLLFDKTAMNNELQYAFAAKVFEVLLQKKPVTLKETGKNLFGDAENQDANLTVLEDYFRWIYKYR